MIERPNESRVITVSDTIRMSDGTEVENTPEAIQEYHESRKRAIEENRQQQERQQQEQKTGKVCPLHRDAQVYFTPCKRDCALYQGDSCALAARPGKVDTNGKPCPFRERCDPSCALYRGAGCSLHSL